MKQKFWVFILVILLSGCAFHSAPKDNQDFYKLSHFSELAGVYKNKGEPSGFLSAIFWGDIKKVMNIDISHEDIEYIEVSSLDNSILLRAIKSGCAIYERTYLIGRDFNMDDGKIIVRKDVAILTRGGDDVLLGPSYEKVMFGLDMGKHGKYRNSSYAAGLLFALFPMAASDTSDIRFDRVYDKPQVFKACGNR
jgi:hypothetical protein